MEELLERGNYFSLNKLQGEEWELGIDEAGRGPVLGPMIYAAAFWPIRLHNEISKVGFTDSKQLSVIERENYFRTIRKLDGKVMGYELKYIDPEYISNKMLSKVKFNLNEISHSAAIELIQRVLDKGVNLRYCYLDTVGPTESYKAKLENIFHPKYPDINFIVSEKADFIYPVVSAASICAKVTRDEKLMNWNF